MLIRAIVIKYEKIYRGITGVNALQSLERSGLPKKKGVGAMMDIYCEIGNIQSRSREYTSGAKFWCSSGYLLKRLYD